MASSKATTVKAYLAELPEGRRQTMAAARALVRKHLPKGYQEVMLHFKSIDDIVPEAVGKVIAAATPDKYVQIYFDSRRGRK
jgi:hypothetical protein